MQVTAVQVGSWFRDYVVWVQVGWGISMDGVFYGRGIEVREMSMTGVKQVANGMWTRRWCYIRW